MTSERIEKLFNEMLDWICEHINDNEDLFIALHEIIGMTQEEIHECSVENLDSYFEKEQSQGMNLSQ